jgi:hypothetical protein
MGKLQDVLCEKLTPDVKETLLRLAQRAYEANAECYDPLIGHDGMTFGLMVHKSFRHFIIQMAEGDVKPWLQVIQRGPQFLFRLFGFTASTYRVGITLEADIAQLFPRNRSGAWILAAANMIQLALPFDGSVEPDDSNCSSLILAHTGNPRDGLCNLFLGVPSRFDEKNIVTGWSTVVDIWKREESAFTATASTGPSQPPKPGVEYAVPPRLTLKETKTSKEEG